MRTYPDELLEHYAERFIALRLARHGVDLAQYLANIERYELLALCCEPPMPAQQAAMLRIWQRWDTGLAPQGEGGEATNLPENFQDWRELIAQWQAEVEAAERQVAHLPQRNGVILEPLCHHRHARGHRGNANFIAKIAKRGA